MSILNHSTAFVIHAGPEVSNNPSLQFGNWKRYQYNLPAANPSGPTEYTLAPGASITPFGTLVPLGLNGSSAFTLSLPNATQTYRLTFVSGGFTGFRTDRAIDFSGNSVTIAINNNSVATFSSPVPLTGVQVGDQVYIPNLVQGDPAGTYPFNALNSGFWTILSISGATFSAKRLSCEGFSGVAETVSVTAPGQMTIFSSSGVQVGDTLDIVSGFSQVSQQSYSISKTTANWLEFTSTVALPLESVVTVGATGLVVYGDSKTWLRIEANQPVVVKINGDTSNSLKVVPTPVSNGWFDSYGNFHSLTIVNKSLTNSATVFITSVE